jgi:hypothetical protein
MVARVDMGNLMRSERGGLYRWHGIWTAASETLTELETFLEIGMRPLLDLRDNEICIPQPLLTAG